MLSSSLCRIRLRFPGVSTTIPTNTGRRFLSATVGREPATEAAFPTFSGPTKLMINNEWREAADGATFDTINPGNEEVIAAVAAAGAHDIDLAVNAAHDAFHAGPWGLSMTPRERGQMIYALADKMEQHQQEFADLEALDNGKTQGMASMVDSPACISMLRYWAGFADKITAGRHIPMGPGFLSYTSAEPVGVVGAITPWNLPLIGYAAKLGTALAAGCTVVLKPAENTPLTAIRLAELAAEVFPAGVVNVVPGLGPVAGQALVEHPKVDKISFTGSLAVGQGIQVSAAETLKRVTLELGGKNPSIVFADADLDNAVESVHNGLFWNKGEACAANTRIFVEDAVFDEFVARATEKVKAIKVGNPFDPTTDQGAMVSKAQFDKVSRYIQGAEEDGARKLFGGNRVGTKGYYLEPSIFVDVDDEMKVFSEEVFGPVMTIARFKSTEEVVRRANATEYGLAAGIFTRDIEKGNQVAKAIRAGMVFWNCYHAVDVAAPFGGMKMSGIGREGGEVGLNAYLEMKNVVTKIQ